MQYALSVFMGLCASIVGIMPPGLLNMTAVKINRNEGNSRALAFACGASVVLAAQSYLAVVFAKFLDKHPEIILMLREAGIVIFSGLTVYFLFIAKSSRPKKSVVKFKSKKSRFFWGMLLSSLNFLTIPFYVFLSLTLASYKVFNFATPNVFAFVAGILVGTLTGFYFFVTFFEKMEHRTTYIVRNMNYIIGTVTGIIALVTLFNVVKFYW